MSLKVVPTPEEVTRNNAAFEKAARSAVDKSKAYLLAAMRAAEEVFPADMPKSSGMRMHYLEIALGVPLSMYVEGMLNSPRGLTSDAPDEIVAAFALKELEPVFDFVINHTIAHHKTRQTANAAN